MTNNDGEIYPDKYNCGWYVNRWYSTGTHLVGFVRSLVINPSGVLFVSRVSPKLWSLLLSNNCCQIRHGSMTGSSTKTTTSVGTMSNNSHSQSYSHTHISIMDRSDQNGCKTVSSGPCCPSCRTLARSVCIRWKCKATGQNRDEILKHQSVHSWLWEKPHRLFILLSAIRRTPLWTTMGELWPSRSSSRPQHYPETLPTDMSLRVARLPVLILQNDCWSFWAIAVLGHFKDSGNGDAEGVRVFVVVLLCSSIDFVVELYDSRSTEGIETTTRTQDAVGSFCRGEFGTFSVLGLAFACDCAGWLDSIRFDSIRLDLTV